MIEDHLTAQPMTHLFPSDAWAAAYHRAINANPDYHEAARDWIHGPVAIVCRADPARGLERDVGIWLDLHEGACREVRLVGGPAAAAATLQLAGPYDCWKAVIRGELEPIAGVLTGRLNLKGNLALLVRHVRLAQVLVKSAGDVPTRFLGE